MGIPWRRALWPMVAALMLALAWVGTAGAAPLVVTAPGGAGTVTIDKHSYLAGERITITGSGFTPAPGGSVGVPVIAVKVNDDWATGWTWGGASEYRDGDGPDGEMYAAFKIEGGAFSGWIDIAGDQAPWSTWLRFLGGSLSTGDIKLSPMTFKADIRVAGAAPTSTVNGGAHPGGSISVSLRDFMRGDGNGGQKVAIKIDRGDTLECIQTNAYGAADFTLPLPAGITLGEHELNALAGTACGEGTEAPGRAIHTMFDVTLAPAEAAITGGNLVPGGTLNVSLSKFLRNDAQGGQKVAFKIDGAGAVLACIQTDANGTGSGSVPIPADIAAGDHVLNVLAGSACGEGAQLPGRSLSLPFTVAAPAPAPAPVPAPAPGTTPTPTPKKKVVAPALRNVTLVNKGKRARIVLRKATPVRTTITVTTAAKVRLAPKAKRAVVTLGKGVVKAKGRIATISLTAKGKRYLAKRPKNAKVRVKVVRAPKGGVRSTQTLVLRVTR